MLSTFSPPHATEPYRIRSNSSASSCDDNSFSPFRPRSFSNASSTSQTSPLHLPELTIPNFSQLIGNTSVEMDLDDIRLDDLNLGSVPNIPDPAEIIREYLDSNEEEINEKSYIHQNKLMSNITVSFLFILSNVEILFIHFQILEPRDSGTVGKSVIKFANSKLTLNSKMDDSSFGSLQDICMIEKHDEERKMMIKNKLNSLIQKRMEIAQNQSTLSFENKKNLESAFDIQIKLLQEELDKLERLQSSKQSDVINPAFMFDDRCSLLENNEDNNNYNAQNIL